MFQYMATARCGKWRGKVYHFSDYAINFPGFGTIKTPWLRHKITLFSAMEARWLFLRYLHHLLQDSFTVAETVQIRPAIQPEHTEKGISFHFALQMTIMDL